MAKLGNTCVDEWSSVGIEQVHFCEHYVMKPALSKLSVIYTIRHQNEKTSTENTTIYWADRRWACLGDEAVANFSPALVLQLVGPRNLQSELMASSNHFSVVILGELQQSWQLTIRHVSSCSNLVLTKSNNTEIFKMDTRYQTQNVTHLSIPSKIRCITEDRMAQHWRLHFEQKIDLLSTNYCYCYGQPDTNTNWHPKWHYFD